MNEIQKAAFEVYARENVPNEVCALICATPEGEVMEFVPNVHHEPAKHFRISRSVLQGKDVRAVIHSHPASPAVPSPADRASCNHGTIPWYIFSTLTSEWGEMTPRNENTPLLGRQFVYGVFDCYTLWRDYYWQKLQIKIMEVESEFGWWNEKKEMYLDKFVEAGFVDVTKKPLKLHDVILMQYGSNVTNHAGIYTENNLLLHHTQGNLSCLVPYGGYWMQHTRKIIRHLTQC